MNTLGIILARGGSKGLPGKNALPLAGKPLAAWTIEHALGSASLGDVVVSSDMDSVLRLAERHGVHAYPRPAELAGDLITVDAAARHAARQWASEHQQTPDAVAILYANVPIRPADLTDRAVAMLRDTGADSVQSVYPVGKQHPFWMRTLGAAGELRHYQPNRVYRRQDLPPVFMLDAGALVVRWASLFVVDHADPHAFLGKDRRGLETPAGAVVDVDTALDLRLAEAVLAEQQQQHTDATHAA